MSWQFRMILSGLVPTMALLVGCYSAHPLYVFEQGDLAHYLETATEIEYPDVNHPRLDEVNQAQAPFTLTDPFLTGCFFDITLEDAVSIALQNSKVIRNLGSVRQSSDGRTIFPDELIGNPQPEGSATIYDPALIESHPFTGVEGALSEFDAQLSASAFWSKRDRPLSIPLAVGGNRFLVQDLGDFEIGISKKAATGTVFSFVHRAQYDSSNQFPAGTPPSVWTAELEMGVTQPLLRGAGTQVNRIPVVVARINEDISLADFESNIRNLVMDVERSYWDLLCQYRILDASKRARDRALETWRDIQTELQETGAAPSGSVSLQGGGRTAEDELRARGQYYSFRAQVEQTLRQLYNAENNLRWLLGLAATDGRLLRPSDEPTSSRIMFDWHEILCEALLRVPELRRQKWVIKQREMELIAARNQVLPVLNASALYRWVGVGDDLIRSERTGQNFPDPRSTAWESLTEGDFQEFRLGLEFSLPIGFRRALAGVRNAQLGLARERSRLEDMELNVSHLLTLAVRDMDGLLVVAQSNFNQFAANRSEVEALELKVQGDEDVNTDFILRAYQRAVAAEIAYHQAICDYNKAIAHTHYRKGSLLEYNNVCLAEGPWPKKAYFDAVGHAKRRSASYYLDYGWSRPRVISQGAVQQHPGTSTGYLVAPQQPTHELVPHLEPIPAGTQPIDMQRSAAVEGTITDEPTTAAGVTNPLGQAASPAIADAIGFAAAGPAIPSRATPNSSTQQNDWGVQQAAYQQPQGAPVATQSHPVPIANDVLHNPLRP